MKNQKGFIPIFVAGVLIILALAMVGVSIYFKVENGKQQEKTDTNQVVVNTNLNTNTETNVNLAANTNSGTNANVVANTNTTNRNANTNVVSGTTVSTNANINTSANIDIATDHQAIVTGKVIYAQGDSHDNNLNAIIKSEQSVDYVLNTRFKLLDYISTNAYTKFHSTYFGVYLRYEDPRNWVRVDFFTAYRPAGKLYVRLLIQEEGGYDQVKSIPIENYDPSILFSDWHDLSVTDTGTNVSVKLDNVEVLDTDYATAISVGMKGYLTTIATRAVWQDMSVVSTTKTTSPVKTTLDEASSGSYGLDASGERYNSSDRYNTNKNPFYQYRNDLGYALPSEWSVGDGLWLYMDVSVLNTGGWKIFESTDTYKTEDADSFVRDEVHTIDYSIQYPGNWTLGGTVFSDENREKIAEFAPGAVYFTNSQSCSDMHSNSDWAQELSKDVITIGNKTGIKIIEKSVVDGGEIPYWYPNRYCLQSGSKAFFFTFYERELDKGDRALFERILSTLTFKN